MLGLSIRLDSCMVTQSICVILVKLVVLYSDVIALFFLLRKNI